MASKNLARRGPGLLRPGRSQNHSGLHLHRCFPLHALSRVHHLIAGRDSGTFYDCFHKNSSLYYKIRVKYEDCPHIEINDPGKAERLKKEYGEQSSFYRSAILGEFTDLDGQSVISRRSLMELVNNPPPFLDTGETCGGFDFAAGAMKTSSRPGTATVFSSPTTGPTRTP